MYNYTSRMQASGERRRVLHTPSAVCQIIEQVTFARCTFIFALRNIALGGFLDTRTVLEIKRVENAFFHSLYIFSVILHAIDKQDIST